MPNNKKKRGRKGGKKADRALGLSQSLDSLGLGQPLDSLPSFPGRETYDQQMNRIPTTKALATTHWLFNRHDSGITLLNIAREY